MSSTTTTLSGFTVNTRPFLVRFLRDEMRVGYHYHEDDEGRWVIELERRHALALANRLKDTPDEQFPGGKWATIQHVEACIAQ